MSEGEVRVTRHGSVEFEVHSSEGVAALFAWAGDYLKAHPELTVEHVVIGVPGGGLPTEGLLLRLDVAQQDAKSATFIHTKGARS